MIRSFKHRPKKKTDKLANSNNFNRGINTIHRFLYTCNVACVHVTFIVITINTTYEDLLYFAAEQESVCIRKKIGKCK